MCRLRYIKKNGERVETDALIKICGSDFDILDKPYYISRIIANNSETFFFRYQDEEKFKNTYDYHNIFKIDYGCATGRLYKLTINTISGRISNLDWSNLLKETDKGNSMDELCNKILLFGIQIVQKIYQDQFIPQPE